MLIKSAFLALLTTAAVANGFAPRPFAVSRGGSLPMSTAEGTKTEGKKAENAPPEHLGWDSHKPVVRNVPEQANSLWTNCFGLDSFCIPHLLCVVKCRMKSPTASSEKGTALTETSP
jgi:hypothetical protein